MQARKGDGWESKKEVEGGENSSRDEGGKKKKKHLKTEKGESSTHETTSKAFWGEGNIEGWEGAF